jgi:cbb3-type cytochrome c oxidase subunit III
VSFFKSATFASLLLATTFASAAPTRSAVEPSPDAMHERMAQIAKDPAALAVAVKAGENAASVCRHCHGAGGNSVLPEVPNLASQNADYLIEQMNKFVHGQRKTSDFMAGMIRALTPEERINAAFFLSQQPVTYKAAPAGEQAAAGKQVYGKLCANCHGAAGTGSQKIPRLAGQQTKYVEDSLKRYRSGSGERIDPKMAAYTRNLKDADIRNIAAYLASLKP